MTTNYEDIIETNDQTEARLAHLEAMRGLVGNVYPNKFARTSVSGVEDTITNIVNFAPVAEIVAEIEAVVATLAERERPPAELKEALNKRLKEFGSVRIAGRLAVPPRVMGKAAFVHLSDGISRLQIYARKEDFIFLKNSTDSIDSTDSTNSTNSTDSTNSADSTDSTDSTDSLDLTDSWKAFGLLDHGDFIGAEGYLFITNTGELSVHVEKLQFLAKAMLPMPDKMHGIADPELRRRYRYVDLIASSLQIEHEEGEMPTRQVFETRAKVVSQLRRFLEDHGYIEVETPMLTQKATGAAAEPFETFHKALGIPLYARIAPELYLKRLVVGGFEKIFELNRNFRNEGLSYKHNPEFTMLEFYCAYMDVNGMMDFAEGLIQQSVQKATGGLKVKYGENEIDFSNFNRISMNEMVADLKKLDSTLEARGRTDQDIVALFEEKIEATLGQPTFVMNYPKSISPLSKASPDDPQIAERFELFINGMEVANGFSELNDPREQLDRFNDQMAERDRGDEEAMVLDEDYIRALSYGMPPAAGIGIGIDRLVMLLTGRQSVRDVILFPHMRPEKGSATEE